MKKIQKIISVIFVSVLAFTLIACSQSNKTSETIDNEKILKDIIGYNQEVLPDLIEKESDTDQLVELYQKINSEFTDKFGKYFTEKAHQTLNNQIMGRIQDKLCEYTLPVHIVDTITEKESTQTITILFKDSNEKEGQFVFKIQNTDEKISFISLGE